MMKQKPEPEPQIRKYIIGAFARAKVCLRDDRGSVESGLTLIPLTILFLVSAQLVFASQWGNAQHVEQQSVANKVAITGHTQDAAARFPRSSSGPTSEHFSYVPLLGGGYMVVSERTAAIPLLANFEGLDSGRFSFRRHVSAVSEVFTQ